MSKTMSSSEAAKIAGLRRRFASGGDHAQNAALSCDPSGIAAVSQELLEEIDYDRPAFNWPSSRLPQNNYHAIEAMAIDVLKDAGFEREAKALSQRMERDPPQHGHLENLLHRFLDFAPAPVLAGPEVDKLKAMAQSLGLDPESVGKAQKKKVANPLAHPRPKTLAEEWQWLVQHANVVSPFGKTAADELSGAVVAQLSAKWLAELGRPLGDPDDPSVGNRAWFDKHFPMGWIHLDHLHDTACVGAPMSFPQRVALMSFEVASRCESGVWQPAEVARFGFDHLNAYGVRGSALIAEAAFDYFMREVRPVLGSTAAHAAPKEPAALHLARANPDLAGLPEPVLIWGAYMLADPAVSQEIEPIILKELEKSDPSRPGQGGATKQVLGKVAAEL